MLTALDCRTDLGYSIEMLHAAWQLRVPAYSAERGLELGLVVDSDCELPVPEPVHEPSPPGRLEDCGLPVAEVVVAYVGVEQWPEIAHPYFRPGLVFAPFAAVSTVDSCHWGSPSPLRPVVAAERAFGAAVVVETPVAVRFSAASERDYSLQVMINNGFWMDGKGCL